MTLATLDQFGFHHTLAATPGVSLVIFTAPSCGSCRRWRSLLADYQAVHTGLSVFEVDAQRDLALTREFGVFHMPALFLFVDGRYHRPLQAAASADGLTAAIQETLALPALDAP